MYTSRIAEHILAGLRRGLSVRAICKEKGMPVAGTVFDWLADPRYEDFAEAYRRARVAGCEAIADEMIEISDDGSKDRKTVTSAKNGLPIEVTDHENVQRSKLRLFARQWYLSKIFPRLYGDRIEVEHKGSVDLVARLAEGRQRALGIEAPQLRVVDDE